MKAGDSEFRDNDSEKPNREFVDKKLLVAMDNKDTNRCSMVDGINKHSDASKYIVAVDQDQNAGEEDAEDDVGEVITQVTTNFNEGIVIIFGRF